MSNDEILREFLLETHENLSLLDSDLVKLEQNPGESSTLSQVFRTFHSVKGTAGFMGLEKLQAVSHAAESLLARLRAGELQLNPAIATALLRSVDAIRQILANIESSGNEGSDQYDDIVAEVERLRQGGHREPQPHSSTVEPSLVIPVASNPVTEFRQAQPVTILQSQTLVAPDSGATVAITPQTSSGDSAELRSAVADTAIRVDVGLLDQLMTLVGELVLARNQIVQRCDSPEDGGLLDAVQRLNLLTTDLQANVMKTRMQPIGTVLNKFPRVVRDISLACGKKVCFEMKGEETELDKTLVEAIRDPLTHLIRNAVDHGIELPSARVTRGKPEEGHLRVVAFHEGGKVIVEISDDGGGIDVERVRAKAISAKLITAEAAPSLSTQELMRLIFAPGFSTAEQVTQFSGRGVGMDVVRTNIEKIGGSVDIESTPGQGTTIRTKIPLTLAIIPALIVVSGGQRFAIPQANLQELVRLTPEPGKLGIERVHGTPLYRLRGELLPLVFLSEQLKLEADSGQQSEINIVVLSADDRPFGLVVDEIHDTQEIVVKPLQKLLKGSFAFAGATIMGDGLVALVLDVSGLARRASVNSNAKRLISGEADSPIPKNQNGEGFQLLLFSPTAGGLMAIPLVQVARLEEFSRSMVESLGGKQVVKYGGEVLPLFNVSHQLDSLNGSTSEAITGAMQVDEVSESVNVVVLASGDERVGLIVGAILDIVVDPIATRFPANRHGVMFTSLIGERITEFLDVATLIGKPQYDLLERSLR